MILFAALPMQVVSATNENPCCLVKFVSTNDFLENCKSFSLVKASSSNKSDATCLAYMKGVIDGYSGSVSINAEIKLANEKNSSRNEVISNLGNHDIHEKLSSYAISGHYLCFEEKVTISEITKNIVKSILRKKLESNKPNLSYVLMNELAILYPCGRK